MNLLFSLLILAATAGETQLPEDANAAHQAEAVRPLVCNFEADSDKDFDDWPDNWQRKRGPGYPPYIGIEIAENPEGDGHALKVTLNGGAAMAMSPAIPINPSNSYELVGKVRTDKLKHDTVTLSLVFLDENGKWLQVVSAPSITSAPTWKSLYVPTVSASSNKACKAIICVEVKPTLKADIEGIVWFDDIMLSQLPKMSVALNHNDHLYAIKEDDPSNAESRKIEVSCDVSGILIQNPQVRFEVFDQFDNMIDKKILPFTAKQVVDTTQHGATNDKAAHEGFTGSAVWRPRIVDYGLYRVKVAILDSESAVLLSKETGLAVIEPHPVPRGGEFGWSLKQSDKLPTWIQLLPQTGISWVKYPVWVGPTEEKRLDELMSFAERMGREGIKSVGILSDPPLLPGSSSENAILSASDTFSLPSEQWYPLIEPIMTQLSLQIRYWQLGVDNDTSLGSPDELEKITRVKADLQRFGQELYLCLPWKAVHELADAKYPPWEVLAFWSDPPFTADELKDYAPSLTQPRIKRWVNIDPLPKKDYDENTRVTDLVLRMLSAKMSHANGIFIYDPYHPSHGLMAEDGSPGELFLAWRTTAMALSGSEYVGSLILPLGSTNHLFARDGKVVMVIWNSQPVQEILSVGDDVVVADIWGRKSSPTLGVGTQLVTVGPTPLFIEGISESAVKWNLAVEFEKERLPSEFGQPQLDSLVLKNTFPEGVSGQVTIGLPKEWKSEDRVQEIKLGAKERILVPFKFKLPLNASSGRQDIRIDFDINADRRYTFSVFRHLDIGLDDVTLEVTSRLNEKEELEVTQRIFNHNETPVSFRCTLVAPGRIRQIGQVVKLGQEEDVKIYRFPNGKELLGKELWLQAQEVNGLRILNQQFTPAE